MLISKRIEVNIYLTEPQLKSWDTVEHRTFARVTGGMIYRIEKKEAQVSEASQYLQTSAEEAKAFLYIGDDMTTTEVTIRVCLCTSSY